MTSDATAGAAALSGGGADFGDFGGTFLGETCTMGVSFSARTLVLGVLGLQILGFPAAVSFCNRVSVPLMLSRALAYTGRPGTPDAIAPGNDFGDFGGTSDASAAAVGANFGDFGGTTTDLSSGASGGDFGDFGGGTTDVSSTAGGVAAADAGDFGDFGGLSHPPPPRPGSPLILRTVVPTT